MSSAGAICFFDGAAASTVQHVPRSPLPPFPPGHYDRDPPPTPAGPDKLYYRGNFSGIRVPGIPLLPGMAGYTVPPWNENRISGPNPPIMALDIPRYWKFDRDLADKILRTYAERGYTHLQCSIGHGIEAGFSIDEWVAYSARVKEYGLFADQWFLGAKNVGLDTRDMDRVYWAPILAPWFDALISNGVVDTACVGWQLDQFNTGTERMIDGWWQSPIQSIIDLHAERFAPLGIPLGTHWANSESGAWNDPYDRFKWWKDQRGKLSWFHHQGDVHLDIPTYQAKLVDTLQPFGDGRMGTSGLFGDRPYGLIVYECSAQAQFDLEMSEDDGDLRGYLLCCTKAASTPSGYGNGARQPDGSIL